MEKTANIGREIEPEENLQVFKARMTSFNPSNGHLELVRGVLISELDTIQMNSHRNRQGSLFHMHSKPGDSGAGIFTLDGKLLALNHSGHPIKKEASGTDISVFRGLSFN